MKKKIAIISTMLWLFLAACSHYTCPTYDNNTGEQKHSGKKKSTQGGLFPKNM
ncbi:MAG TPA: hypothetical protein VNJ07_10375 [Chitinophagales bacterium]|nr:hypothetical protein [Chitinophagales bacterium]